LTTYLYRTQIIKIMTITPQQFLEALKFWENQAHQLIKDPHSPELDWGSILQDMEDWSRVMVVDGGEDEGPEFDSAGFTDDDRMG
jgi:hypothetical protein